jgi:hypothetical protein
MKNALLVLATCALVTSGLVATKACAAPAFMVVDGTGRAVGMLAFSDGGSNNYIMRSVITQAGRQWFGIQADVNGFVSVGTLPVAWYENSTCSGQPFIPTGSARFSLVQHVVLINGAVMLPDPAGVKSRTILSYSFGNGGCGTSGTPFTALSTDPLFADQTHYGFVAPFSVVRVP